MFSRLRSAKALSMAAVLVALASGAAKADADAASDYPNRPVRIVVGYQAGGPTDVVARLLAKQLQTTLGQPFVVDNRPGAGSNIASDQVAGAKADGYTLLFAAAPIASNGFIYKNLKWDIRKSFEPISQVMSAPAILAVSPTLPVHTLAELIALAKKQPGKLSFASTGNGGTQHLAGEMLMQQAGVNMIHVPYKGASSVITDLIAGNVSMAFMTSVSAMPYLKAGQVRPIAVTAPKRLALLPGVPTMAEGGLPGLEVDSWSGLFAPAGTPRPIIEKLQQAVIKAVGTAEMRDNLQPQGAVLVGNTSREFKAYIDKDVEHMAKLFKTVKVTLD
ncbi:tripartite tricarboxylate transporter substrate binding protein (plasmid) [Cupriavidus necator]|uniref:Tripartite tricarboxylate transporter substrate binding protein n=1 Tax=Cupriavidus necator TaxID=106590 RepID=A0A1U9V476_CUPNE|nr:tripartite tricarboxylate transporter substrate binding protein [Cupriavidus necator]AQV99215.1 tripartite tricarboxylate transporter substrate binding protein [Cupriavidus necator]